MSQRKIILLSAFMSFALLGLIYFQVHWIKNAVRLQEEEFRQQVRDALGEVSAALENEEIISSTLTSTHKVGINSLTITLHDDEFNASSDSAQTPTFNVLSFTGTDGITKKIPDSAQDSLLLALKVHKYSTVEGDQTNKTFTIKETNEVAKRLDDKLKRLENSTTLLYQHLEKSSLGVENRLDSLQIDTLIRQALLRKQIKTHYQWQVAHIRTNAKLFGKSLELIEASAIYQEALFPSDIFNSETVLKVAIPHQRQYVLETMSLPLGASALLMLTVMGCFAYAVQTIVKQKKLSEIKADFINNMTHELKTPIATVGMACEALNDPDLARQPNIQQRYLGIIAQENKRLAQQVEKVLQISRLERSELQINYEDVNLDQLLQQLDNTYSLQLSQPNQLTLSLRAENNILQADRMQLSSLFGNLIDNAIKYSGQSPKITIETESTTLDNKPAILISVSDSGIGMARENLGRIFDKFYRVSTGNLHNVKGFGLGLAFVKHSVDAHHGTIKVSSKPNLGSTFTITLPNNPLTHVK